MGKYTCQNCGCTSGYHWDEGDKYGACRVIGKRWCKEFVWSDHDYNQYLKAHGFA